MWGIGSLMLTAYLLTAYLTADIALGEASKYPTDHMYAGLLLISTIIIDFSISICKGDLLMTEPVFIPYVDNR